MKSGLVGVVGAIMLAVGMLALGRAKVPAGSFAGMPRRRHFPRSKSGVIYTAAGAADAADDSSEDTRPSDQDIVRRRREYASAFVISAGILLIAIILGAFVFRRRAAAAAGIAALAALGMGALLQFMASKGLPDVLVAAAAPLAGTFAADFMLAVMFAGGGWNDAAARDATGDGIYRDRRDSMVGNSCICRRSRPHA